MENILQVGIISSTHGIRGEVKVFPTTDDVNRFKKLKEVLLDTGKEMLPLTIEGVKFFKQFVILKFKGIDDINDIERYRGKSLYVTRENAVKLKKDEYFIADLIGLFVENEDGSFQCGLPGGICGHGIANDVYIVTDQNTGKEVLIPAIKDCILQVDVEQGFMKVHLLDGLLSEK